MSLANAVIVTGMLSEYHAPSHPLLIWLKGAGPLPGDK